MISFRASRHLNCRIHSLGVLLSSFPKCRSNCLKETRQIAAISAGRKLASFASFSQSLVSNNGPLILAFPKECHNALLLRYPQICGYRHFRLSSLIYSVGASYEQNLVPLDNFKNPPAMATQLRMRLTQESGIDHRRAFTITLGRAYSNCASSS